MIMGDLIEQIAKQLYRYMTVEENFDIRNMERRYRGTVTVVNKE